MPRKGNCFRCGRHGHHANECPTNPDSKNASSKSNSSRRVVPSSAPRNQERRFFDKMTKDESAVISGAEEAERLLRAAIAFKQEEGSPGLLYRLADPTTLRAGSLRKALEFITHESVFCNGFLPLLEILGGDDLGKPVYKIPLETVLQNFYDMKFLLPELLNHLREARAAQCSASRTALIWFLTKLALKDAQVRGDETVIQMANLLSAKSGQGAECLETVLAGNFGVVDAKNLSLADVRVQQAEVPGGRHANDFADFRSIRIIPTIEEFLCPADPFLPKAPTGPVTAAQLLDRQFRLLREDILGPAKEEQDDRRKEQRDLFEGVRASHVVTGEPVSKNVNGKTVRITGPSDPCICFSFRIPHWHRVHRLQTQSEKENYWEQTRRILPRDALVCLLRQNCDGEWAPIRFGTIVRRETKELAVSGKTKPVIGIAFFSEEHILESLTELSDSCLPPTRLLVVSAELFAYQPILRGLQMMDSVPFAEEILKGELPSEQSADVLQVPADLKEKVERLDDGQRDALNYALSNRLSLIQGPPGTGKTYIGVMLAQTILSSTSETILCVCYTNHALDDFLEGLLDAGIRDIVRVGGRSKNERLAEFNLREKAKDGRAPFTREQSRRYAQLKTTIEEEVKQVESIQKICRREIGKGWWRTVEPHLQGAHPEAWQQLRVDRLTDDDGFKIVGVESEDHLWKIWISGKKACAPFEDRNSMSLWSLSKEERTLKKLEWQHELYEEHRLSLHGSLKAIKNAKDELKQLQDGTDSVILSQTRVIACTTTKAAMCKHLLDDVSAGVVLVEEAAEIFESHILTSLSKRTKRLIMIGDHRQLRPKAQHYPLTVESNRQYDLNRSLFERLAQVLPTSKLGIQHRMHPLISAIPRLTTYQDLKDAPSTATHPMVKGLQSRLIFIDHTHSEDCHNTQIERVDAISKTNQYEVELVVAIVRYLFQQGYQPNNLVVLTPYLGQLMKIQKALSSTWNVFIDDLDFNEAKSLLQGVEGFELSSSKKGTVDSSVRVATIDNYQGEEADIVIASLVRSNLDHNIGFLREPERVNVLLSRARDCEIIIGNRMCLEGARGSFEPLRGGRLWKEILGHLDSLGNIFNGLPVVCQSHKNKAVLETAEATAEHSPDGGCSEMCAKVLECGHPCTKRCHVGPCATCAVSCGDICPRGHSIIRKCGDATSPKCLHTISWKCPLGHAMSGVCFRGKDSSQCAGCERLRETEEAQLRVGQMLQETLDQKHHQLESRRAKLDEALRDEAHRKQLSMIDEEMVLVERQLEEMQEKEALTVSNTGAACDIAGDSFKGKLNKFVRRLLSQSESKSLPVSEIVENYHEDSGEDIQLEANRFMGENDGKQMSYRSIFEALPCCEIVPAVKSRRKNRKQKGFTVRLLESEPESDMESNSIRLVPTHGETRRGKTARVIDTGDEVVFPEKKARIGDPCIVPDVCMGDVAQESGVGTPIPGESSIAIAANQETTANAKNSVAKETMSTSNEEESESNFTHTDSFDTLAAVSDVVKRFNDEGALAADNLLDEIKNDPLFTTSSEIQSLEYIIGEVLDPSGNLARPPPKPEIDSSLCQAVCLYAYSLYCSMHDFPLQASQSAHKLLRIANDDNLLLPTDWLERTQNLSRTPGPKTNAKPIQIEETPEETWSLILTSDSKAPKIMMDSVLPMIGLVSVKKSMIAMYHRIRLAQEQNDGVAASYNIRFEGNPGTGKTTIARHYGTFLQQLLVLPEGSIFKETSGAKLINDGIPGLRIILNDIKESGGGVVFCDEAYQLISDREGRKVLDFILPLAESLDSEFGPLVWIFAGYKKEMEKLFEHNVGLRSRFPHHFLFEDYTDGELRQIFVDMMKYQTKPSSAGTIKPKRRTRKPSAFQPSLSRSHMNGSKTKCRLGRTWTYFQYSGWTDTFGNRTVDPKQLGLTGSELVDPSGQFWEEEDGTWFNLDAGTTQTHYPGEPAPSTSSRSLRPKPFHCHEDDLTIAIRRLGRRRGQKGFGNARAVRVLFEKVRDRQACRLTEERNYGRNPDMFRLTRNDLLGPDITSESLKKSDAWKTLESMEGLLPVKESVEQLFRLVLNNVGRERNHQPLYEVALNRLFLGNPGTGKTTVAKLYGQILVDLGLLSKGEVVLKCASDFVGDVLGSSEKTTRSIIESAEGCVLVIDEAYALYSGGKGPIGNNDPYKTAVIDTIVEQIQARPGADIAVVMLGYQAEMENMLAKVNPGLSRRFQLENAFHFPDFDDAALIRILLSKAREQELGLSLDVAKRAVRTLAKARAKPNFGNAGAVDNMLSQAVTRMQKRDKNCGNLTLEDFDYSGDGHDESSLDTLFDGLIGCKEVRETMEDLRDTVDFSKAQGKYAANSISYNYLFLGSPGTGKTTVARRMGKMFEALGLLPCSEMKEVKASDLLTGYVGQAGKKTRELLREARGGVLFIDEAYQMDPRRGGSFMTEAVDELVGALTEDEFKGQLLVILAGYDKDMEAMLSANPGLQSRFSERVHFHDFDANATAELLQLELEKKDIPLEIPDLNDLCRLAQKLVNSEGFGNGRDVVTWADRVFKQVAKKYANMVTEGGSRRRSSLTMCSKLEDIAVALDLLLSSRKVRTGGPQCSTVDPLSHALPTMADTADVDPPHPPTMVAEQRIERLEDEEKCVDIVDDHVMPENLFAGVDDMTLQGLQVYIEKEGLDSEDGVQRLSNLDPSSADFMDLLSRLVDATGMEPDAARDQLLKWQAAQKELRKTIEETKQGVIGARPIWRCAVCGRANKPWIACYVAPYIVGYEKVTLGDLK